MINKINDILSDYEELINYVAEAREGLELTHHWLAKKPDMNDFYSYYDLLALHSQHFALLNLVMYRLDELHEKNNEKIKNYRKEIEND